MSRRESAEMPLLRVIEFAACEGGATAGLQRAGCHVTVVDVDKAALARNPGDVKIRTDALTIDPAWVAHAASKCRASRTTSGTATMNGANPNADEWPDLVTPGRALLDATGLPYVMENVPKSPLRRDLILHGPMFGLTAVDTDGTLLHLDRHRVFESNVPLRLPPGARPVSPHRCGPRPGVQWAGVYGGARKDKIEARKVRKGGYVPPDADVQSALLGGVPWMTEKGRRECIPPVYSSWIASLLREAVEVRRAA